MPSGEVQCCGEPFSLGSRVSWAVRPADRDDAILAMILGDEEVARVTHVEDHHTVGLFGHGRELTGTVTSIEAIECGTAPLPGPDTHTRYPVEASRIVTVLTHADGWETDKLDPDGPMFYGYLIDLDVERDAELPLD